MNSLYKRSLAQLTGLEMKFDEASTSPLSTKVRDIWMKPVGEYSNSELRIMIGQGFGLDVLVPLAMERLEENPFIRADLYYGDLLLFVLSVPPEFWKSSSDSYWTLVELVSGIPSHLTKLTAKIESFKSMGTSIELRFD